MFHSLTPRLFLFGSACALSLSLSTAFADPPPPPEPKPSVDQLPPAAPLPADRVEEFHPRQARSIQIDVNKLIKSSIARSKELVALIDEMLPQTNGLLESRLLDARSRTVALGRDFLTLEELKGEVIRERFTSVQNRTGELLTVLKVARGEMPPPPPAFDTLLDLATGLKADAAELVLARVEVETPPADDYVVELSRADFDGVRDRFAQLDDTLSRFALDKQGQVRTELELTRNILASSQRDLRTVIVQQAFDRQRLASLADRVATVRDRLSDVSGRFDDVPRTQLGTMRGEAERLHTELVAIQEGRVVGGPIGEVRVERARVNALAQQTSLLMEGKQGKALDELDAAREGLAKVHQDLGDVINEKGEYIPAQLEAVRAQMAPIRTHLKDAGVEMPESDRKVVNQLSAAIDGVEADLSSMADNRPLRSVRTAKQPKSDAPR